MFGIPSRICLEYDHFCFDNFFSLLSTKESTQNLKAQGTESVNSQVLLRSSVPCRSHPKKHTHRAFHKLDAHLRQEPSKLYDKRRSHAPVKRLDGVPALRLLIASAAIIFYNGEASKVWISNSILGSKRSPFYF